MRKALCLIPAMTYFRTGMHYHRPQKLNERVRNGNECFQLGIVTGNAQRHQSTEADRTPLRVTYLYVNRFPDVTNSVVYKRCNLSSLIFKA